jgi:hypothetical protein
MPSLIVKLAIRQSSGIGLPNKRKRGVPANDEADKKAKSEVSASMLTTTFLAYLENVWSSDEMETTSLAAIEEALTEIASSLPGLLQDHASAPYFTTALANWVAYRRVLAAVHTAHGTPLLASEVLSRFTIKIKNSRLLTELRVARVAFVETEAGGLHVEEVLAEGFGALQKTGKKAKKVCKRVEERLGDLVEDLVELGDALGEDAGGWVVMA